MSLHVNAPVELNSRAFQTWMVLHVQVLPRLEERIIYENMTENRVNAWTVKVH